MAPNMTIEDARMVVRRWGTPDEKKRDPSWIPVSIAVLWPDAEDAEAMRDILLPECILMSPVPEAWCGMDREQTFCGRVGRLTPVRDDLSIEFSVITARRWPTCGDCRALLLECREWMPEWWAVEEMTEEEARHAAFCQHLGQPFPERVFALAIAKMERAVRNHE